MNALKTTWSATQIGLRSIPERLGTSLVVVVGVAIVVTVFITVLAMASGLTKAAAATGKPWRAIVLGGSAETEAGSSLSRDSILTISNAPGIRRGSKGEAAVLRRDARPSCRCRAGVADSTPSPTVRGVGPAALSAATRSCASSKGACSRRAITR